MWYRVSELIAKTGTFSECHMLSYFDFVQFLYLCCFDPFDFLKWILKLVITIEVNKEFLIWQINVMTRRSRKGFHGDTSFTSENVMYDKLKFADNVSKVYINQLWYWNLNDFILKMKNWIYMRHIHLNKYCVSIQSTTFHPPRHGWDRKCLLEFWGQKSNSQKVALHELIILSHRPHCHFKFLPFSLTRERSLHNGELIDLKILHDIIRIQCWIHQWESIL